MRRIHDLKAYIEANSIPVPETGCWLWLLTWSAAGYGGTSLRHASHKAHRVSYSAFKGDPGKLFVCHRCDTPSCVNPDHLFLGTNLDNSRDMVSKGRAIKVQPKLRGEQHTLAKLTNQQALEIKRSQGRHLDIARRFGIARQTVSRIKNGQYWSWLEEA